MMTGPDLWSFTGLLLLVGGILLPPPIGTAASVAGCVVVFSRHWARTKGWQRWWPVGLLSLVTIGVWGLGFGTTRQLGNWKVMLGLLAVLAVGGIARPLLGLARVIGRAAYAIVGGLGVVREMRKRGTRVDP